MTLRLSRLITSLTIAALTYTSMLAAESKPTTKPATATITVTLTLGDIANSQPALAELFNFKLPVRVSWPLGDNVAAIESKLTRFNTERNRLIKDHKGVLDTKTNLITFPPAEVEGWNADLKALGDIKVELTVTPIPLSLLPESVNLSASDMAHLRPFFIDDLGVAAAPAIPPPSKTK